MRSSRRNIRINGVCKWLHRLLASKSTNPVGGNGYRTDSGHHKLGAKHHKAEKAAYYSLSDPKTNTDLTQPFCVRDSRMFNSVGNWKSIRLAHARLVTVTIQSNSKSARSHWSRFAREWCTRTPVLQPSEPLVTIHHLLAGGVWSFKNALWNDRESLSSCESVVSISHSPDLLHGERGGELLQSLGPRWGRPDPACPHGCWVLKY